MTVRDRATVLILALAMGATRIFATEPESPLVPALVTVPAPFIPLPPCRIADTREPTMPPGYGPPSLTPGPPPRSFDMWGRCGIPVGATAVSLNVTAVNPQGLGYVLLYPTGGPQPGVSTLNFLANQTVANAALVPLGLGGAITAATAVSPTDFIIDTNGYYAGSPMDPVSNLFLGYIAGNPLMDGNKSTGIGFAALSEVTTGDGTAAGYRALRANGAAYSDVAIGAMALDALSGGFETVAFGQGALALHTDGFANVAVGAGTLHTNLGSAANTAIGTGALSALPDFFNVNTALGYAAGSSTTAGGGNFYVASPGSGADSSTIRIGSVVQTRAFLAGIRNASISAGLQVWIDPAGQLGTPVSSARYKEDVADAAAVSGRVQGLRPVRFRYRDQADEDSHYGLIAEEVERVLPELVVCDSSGEALTVLYDEVSILVLSELQKQARRLADGREKLNARREILEREEAAIDARERELGDLERRFTTIRIPPDTMSADESAEGGLR